MNLSLPFRKTDFNLFATMSLLLVFVISSCSEQEPNPVVADQPSNQSLAIVPVIGEPIEIKASGVRAGDDAKTSPDDRGRFEITLKFITPVTDQQRQVFEDAAERWQRIIIKDVPSITATGAPIPSAFIGFPPVAEIGETIDDIIIEVALAQIDGPGNILGQAGPRFVRNVDLLTLSGVMFFDVADLALLDQFDLFEEVIVHEMGHVLGLGSLWNFQRMLRQGPAADPFFAGQQANVFWNAEGGAGLLPIENMGGAGTALSHWREGVLNNELMTGFLNLGYNPLSRITAGSMRDLGYGAAMVGDQYDLPKGAPGVGAKASEDGDPVGLHIAEMEEILEPVGIVTVK